jgi:mono/diheme cytochrome c family protein
VSRVLTWAVAVASSSVVLAAACGTTHEGPPPRYADAPAEPNPSPAPAEPDAGTRAVEPDAGVAVADAGAPAADGGDADAGAPAGPVLATGSLTQEQWTSMLEGGRRKWNRVCGECHGTGIGPALNGRRMSADRVRATVRRGRGDMRPLSQRRISDEELEAVIVYLSTIRAVADVTPPP